MTTDNFRNLSINLSNCYSDEFQYSFDGSNKSIGGDEQFLEKITRSFLLQNPKPDVVNANLLLLVCRSVIDDADRNFIANFLAYVGVDNPNADCEVLEMASSLRIFLEANEIPFGVSAELMNMVFNSYVRLFNSLFKRMTATDTSIHCREDIVLINGIFEIFKTSIFKFCEKKYYRG